MNEYGQIIAQWLACSQSPGELNNEIRALKARYPEGAGVIALWLDSENLAGPFQEHFVSLKNVLVDVFHLEQRFTRCVPKEWTLKGQLMALLSKAYFQIHEEDVILYHLHAQETKGESLSDLRCILKFHGIA